MARFKETQQRATRPFDEHALAVALYKDKVIHVDIKSDSKLTHGGGVCVCGGISCDNINVNANPDRDTSVLV